MKKKKRWKDILLSKYDSQHAQSQLYVNYHSYWWCDFSKSCGEGHDGGWFKEVVRWRMGSGDKVKFWEDAWAGSTPLINMYPRLFFVSLDKGMMVAEVGEWEDFVWH